MNRKLGAQVSVLMAIVVFASFANAALVITGDAANSIRGPTTNLLNFTATSIGNTDTSPPDPASRNLTIVVTGTDFNPIVSDILTAASGTFLNATGSTITFNWYIDRNNLQLTTELIDSFTFSALDADESFSHNFTADLLNDVTDLYSMTISLALTIVAGGSLTNLSQTEQSPVLQAAVPEPATLALLGLGLAGLSFSRRKQ